jgi:hypothetical protein
MRQLVRRIQRLECTGTFVDVHRSLNRLVHEAALEVHLPVACHQQLATAIDARLHALRQILPASFTNARQIATMVREVCQAVRSVGRYCRGRTPALWTLCGPQPGVYT